METEEKTNSISREELLRCNEIIKQIWDYYGERIVGQRTLGISLLVSLITNSHILLESVPGLAKTTAAKVITDAVSGRFSRIQCTPDLLPSDIMGTQIYNQAKNSFETKVGPVYSNFVLLDEINRSSAKTQSAMLEAMQERQITIGGEQYKLPDIFMVIATQNPIEQEGTYLLAEAQLDRFLLKEKLDYPNKEEELEVLNRIENDVFINDKPILKLDDVTFLQQICKKVYMDKSIKEYIISIIDATRHIDKVLSKDDAQYVNMGSSTRGAIAFMEGAKAMALIKGRNYVIPDDVKELKYSVLRHRIELNFSAVADGVSVESIIDKIIGAIKTP